MVWLGAVINAVAYLLWAIALKGAKDSAKIANLAYLVPFLSILLSWLVLKEQITIYALFALVLIVGGILLQSINIKRRSKENRSDLREVRARRTQSVCRADGDLSCRSGSERGLVLCSRKTAESD